MKRYIRCAVVDPLDEPVDVQSELARFSTRAAVLDRLSYCDKPLIRKYVAQNPHTSVDTLSRLASDNSTDVICCVLINPSTPSNIRNDIIDTIAGFTTIHTQLVYGLDEVARSPNTSTDTLIKLAEFVVSNTRPSMSASEIYNPLLKNPNTPTEALEILLDYDTHAQSLIVPLIKHPNVTLGVLKELLIRDNGYCGYFDKIADIHTLPREFLEYFVDHGSNYDRRSIAKCSQTPPDLLKRLAADNDGSGYIASDAISNSNLSEEDLLEIFNATGDTHVIYNSNCPASILTKIANKYLAEADDWKCARIAGHPNTPIDVLYDIFNKFYPSPCSSSLGALAKNPNVPADISAKLATFEDFNDCLKKAVAKNPNTDPDVLASLVKSRYEVRSELAKNPNTPVAALKKLAKDRSQEVVYQVMGNPSITDEIINILIDKSGGRPHWRLRDNPRYKELYGG